MASIGHVAIGLAAGRASSTAMGRPLPPWRWMAALSALSLLPDLDAIAFRLGIPYAAPFGHRGATHSLAFALLIGLVAAALAPSLKLRPLRAGALVFAVVATHPLLDTMTTGGLGCALLFPFSTERFFAPWRPIPVAPIGRRLLSPWGYRVMTTELLQFLPLLLYGLWPRRRVPGAATVAVLAAVMAASGCGDAASMASDLSAIPSIDSAALLDLSTEDSSPALSPEMVRVPPGTFTMGCNMAVDAECFPDELPAHPVTLAGFDLDRLPATQRDFDECVRAGTCMPPAQDFDPAKFPDLPVNYISWQQAADYCRFRGKRLSTEAEWERAARGDDGRKYPWGNTPAPDCMRTNASPCGRRALEPVGIHLDDASPYGALDMAGNIWQWVSDWYDAGYYAVSPISNPTGPAATMGLKAKRGGAFSFDFAHLRTSTRYAHNPLAPDVDIGVRCARSY